MVAGTISNSWRFILKRVIISLLVLAMVMFWSSCSGPLDAKSEVVNGWTVSRSLAPAGSVPTTATKTFETTDFTGTFEFIGGEKAIQKLLDGAYEIGFASGTGEQVILASKSDKASYQPDTIDPTVMGFRVFVTRKSAARSTNFGGTLSAGNTVWMQNDWVWWGANAWCTPSSGNTNLELWKNSWGQWGNVSSSSNPGTATDQVYYNHGFGWAAYKLNIIAVVDSAYTGQVSW
jgi:hypothetical protein